MHSMIGVITETTYQDGNHHEYEQQHYHIVCVVDRNFIRHAWVTIRSLIEHVNKGRVHFHLITSEEVADMAYYLRALIAGTTHSIHVHHLSEKLFANLPSTEYFSKAIYYRLLAPYLLESETTMLYLDADIVCLNAFTEFYNSRLAYTDIALVVSEEEHLAPMLAANIGLQDYNYFNSGVLLINIQRWLHENISSKVVAILETQGNTFQYMDQDALNIVLEDKVKFVEKKYNFIFMLGHQKADYIATPPVDTVFLHYAGANKPWQKWNQQVATEFYKNVYINAPWLPYQIDIPKNYKQAKKMYKLMLRKKKYLSSMHWYLVYIKFRYGK